MENEPLSPDDRPEDQEKGPVRRVVDAARGSGVGTEDPNIVGDAGPTDVPPGRDPETEVAPGVVADDDPDAGAQR